MNFEKRFEHKDTSETLPITAIFQESPFGAKLTFEKSL
ncbi:hypothetical protein MNV_2070001 [Candidatus Methanoperedens nitroreducens]|uniref:Uncharacterized protein n=1 Tax=Candidatus Methanoperedens nitratireducens TaxID=1392998 RepID=A0A284VNS3_9EURY|nr:hypothetical protein MNV_2070001 [Candidatus Methanoperedens nitroreducens]